jgi:hypothetical protein
MILKKVLLVLTLAACSGSQEEAASCQQEGMTCARNEDCNQWDCHCPEDTGGDSLAFIVAFCSDGRCASASEACDGICMVAIAPDQATNAGCQ